MSNIINGIAKDLKAIPKNFKAKTGNIDKKKLFLMKMWKGAIKTHESEPYEPEIPP